MIRHTITALLMTALPAGAAGFTCSFAGDCGADAACPPVAATLTDSTGTWALTLAGAPAPIQHVDLPESTIRHFIVAPVDADAGAVSLLSIFEDGTALITTHGDFLTPQAFTLTGACTREST